MFPDRRFPSRDMLFPEFGKGLSSTSIRASLLGAIVSGAILFPLAPAPARADITQAEAALAARDDAAAIAFLQPLAAGGDSYAAWKLAELYLAGRGGSQAEGIALLQQAAAGGDPDAQARLGVLHAKGSGVTQDDVAAYQWLTLATRGAAPGRAQFLAETNLAVVAQRLSPDQRAAALAGAENAATAYLQTPAEPAAPEAVATETTMVEPLAPVAVPQPAATSLAASYRIQLASVRNPNDVDNEWARLRKRIGAPLDGLQLHVQDVDLGGQGIYHRLQAGPFASRAEAAEACAGIKAGGADCLVVAP